MTKENELKEFLARADELIEGKYILADIKIVNLLKVIASSETLLALFKNCLTDFDYESAKRKYLVKNPYLPEEKGQFVQPDSTRDLLAFVFSVLVDIDAKRINLTEFLDKYFYEDGSCFSGYTAFINAMIKPLKSSVKMLMESVIEGKLQDPLDALCEQERQKKEAARILEEQKQREFELSKQTYGKSILYIKKLLLEDKQKIASSSLKEAEKGEITYVIDMLVNVLESNDKDAIDYAFIAYKYVARVHKKIFFRRVKKISLALKDIVNEL